MFFNKKNKPEKTDVSIKPLSGFIELLPEDQILFNKIIREISKTYESFGFLPMETPTIEREEILLAKAGGETEKEIYKIKKGDKTLALRFDLTVPLARYVSAYYNDLVFPFKRYQIGKVYRGERPQKGRFREFYQCDVDIIGDGELSLRSDAEVLNLVYTTFDKLDIGQFIIRISNRKILIGLLESLNLKNKEQQILRIIDKKLKIGDEETIKLLKKEKIDAEKIDKIFEVLNKKGTTLEVINFLQEKEISNETFINGVQELKEILELLSELGIPDKFYEIDLTIIRGLDYYTGTVFETFLLKDLDIGSISSGGRYDNLTESYSDKKLIGVGASIGFSRLFIELKKRGLINGQNKVTSKVIVIPLTDSLEEVGRVAKALRLIGINTEIYLEKASMKKKLNYANKQNIPFVILVGDEEIKMNKFTLKNMTSGEQEKLSLEDILNKIN